MIEVSQLQVVRDGKTICAVEHLTVEPGTRLTVTGANGSGKSTLLRVMAELTNDYAGTCRVAAHHQQRTYVHQQPFLFRGSVLSNVRYGQHARRLGRNRDAVDWLRLLGIEHLAGRTTRNLSGGEIRRVALARALAIEPRLLLLDEPLAELDDQASETVCRVLSEMSDTTIVIASPTALPEALRGSTYVLSSGEFDREQESS